MNSHVVEHDAKDARAHAAQKLPCALDQLYECAMKKLSVLGLIPVAALAFVGCVSTPLTGRVTFGQSAPSSTYGNGKVKLVTNNAGCGTKWCLYSGSVLCTPTLVENQVISANPLIPNKANITATAPNTVQPSTLSIPVTAQKLTTITVTY